MLKVMNKFVIHWLTRVRQVAWKTDEVPMQWQTTVLTPIHKKEIRKKASTTGAFFY